MEKKSLEVMLVDDEPIILNFLREIISTHPDIQGPLEGINVNSYGTGFEALSCLGKGYKPDIIFTDIVMPGGVDGVALAKRALELCPKVKIIGMSGYSDKEREKYFHDNGIPFLNKPFKMKQVIDTFNSTRF